jgi:hypothetical protein
MHLAIDGIARGRGQLVPLVGRLGQVLVVGILEIHHVPLFLDPIPVLLQRLIPKLERLTVQDHFTGIKPPRLLLAGRSPDVYVAQVHCALVVKNAPSL